MTAGIQLLLRLKEAGYFEHRGFDPAAVFDVCRSHLLVDVATAEGSNKLSSLINSLVDDGLVIFEYSRDPSLHPKDVLDYWRLILTPAGLSKVNRASVEEPDNT